MAPRRSRSLGGVQHPRGNLLPHRRHHRNGLRLGLPALVGILALIALVPVWRGQARNGKTSAALLGAYSAALFVVSVFTLGFGVLAPSETTPLVTASGGILLVLSGVMVGVSVGGWRRWGGAATSRRSLVVLAAPVAAVAVGLVVVPLVAPLPDAPKDAGRFTAASADLKTGRHAYEYTTTTLDGTDKTTGVFDYEAKTLHQDAYDFGDNSTGDAIDASGAAFADSAYQIGSSTAGPWQILDTLDIGGGTWMETTSGTIVTYEGSDVDCDSHLTFAGWDDLNYRQKQERTRWRTELHCDVTVVLEDDKAKEVQWTYRYDGVDKDDLTRFGYTFD